jgi:hypothetical protein
MQRDPTAAFATLQEFLSAQNPVTLLSQLTLTFLFVPEAEFQGESSETAAWERRIEFIAGYLLVRVFPTGDFPTVDGQTLEAVQQMVDEYYQAVSMHMMVSVTEQGQPSPEDVILRGAKVHAMYVRGDAYPHQFEQFAIELYGPANGAMLMGLGGWPMGGAPTRTTGNGIDPTR